MQESTARIRRVQLIERCVSELCPERLAGSQLFAVDDVTFKEQNERCLLAKRSRDKATLVEDRFRHSLDFAVTHSFF